MPVTLRAIREDDLRSLYDWRNELVANFRQWRPLTWDDHVAWFKSLSGHKWPDHIMFAIETETLTLVGACGLTYVDYKNRRAEASIYVGRDRAAGNGKAALEALCKFGFEMGLAKITAEIFDFNAQSRALFESCGFTQEGVLARHHFARGGWHNSILYARFAEPGP